MTSHALLIICNIGKMHGSMVRTVSDERTRLNNMGSECGKF